MTDAILRDSMVGIKMGQCLVLYRESPKGVSAHVKHLVNSRIIAVKEYGEGTCIGCSMDPVSFEIRHETCIGWVAFRSHSEYSARM